MKKFYLVLIIIVLMASPIFSAEKMRLAVIDFVPNNVTKYLARAVSENINTELAKKSQYFDVIERSRIKSIVAEQGLQMTGITDSKSAVKMGKLLSAKKILVGTVSKVGNVFTMTVRVIDVETGRVKFAESERCTKVDDVDDASRYLAFKLINRITGENFKLPKRDYSREEGRNKFAIGFSFQVSMPASNGSHPTLSLPGGSNPADFNPELVLYTADQMAAIGMALSFIMSYELKSFFTLRLDTTYILTSAGQSDGTMTPTSSSYGDISISSNNFYYVYNSLKIDVFGQFNLKLEGFMPYVALGVGYQFFLSEKETRFGDFSVYDSSVSDGNNYQISIQGNIMNLTPEIGCSIYFSKYVEMFFAIGAVIPVLYDVYDNIKIKESIPRSSALTGNLPTIDSKLKGFNGSVKGVLPIEIYAKVGFLFRLF